MGHLRQRRSKGWVVLRRSYRRGTGVRRCWRPLGRGSSGAGFC
jgi:hypothetical protein